MEERPPFVFRMPRRGTMRYQDAAARTRERIETQTLTEKEDMVQKANPAEEKLEVHNVLQRLFLGKDPVITECLQS